jgi:hypothetical protein
MLELGDQQLQVRHHRLCPGGARFSLATGQLFGRKRGAEGVRRGIGSLRHADD